MSDQETRHELEQRMDELARLYAKNHDPKIREEIETLSKRLAGWKETLQ